MKYPKTNDKTKSLLPILLDTVSVQLGVWGEYHVLTKHHGVCVFRRGTCL